MATLSINACHRRHYKSGSCLDAIPLDRPLVISKRFQRLLDAAGEMFRRRREAGDSQSTLIRPEYFKRKESVFGRFKAKVLSLFGGKAA